MTPLIKLIDFVFLKRRAMPLVTVSATIILIFQVRAKENATVLTEADWSSLHDIVETYADIYLADDTAIGLSLGVWYEGTSHSYHFGEVERGGNRLPGDTDYFGIGSIGKVFTTTLLAKAMVENRISLTDDIRVYLPDGYENLQWEGTPIRIVHLANHTSGLPNAAFELPEDLKRRTEGQPFVGEVEVMSEYTQTHLLSALRSATLDTAPGEVYRYSNNETKVLVLILERLYELPYQIIFERYFQGELGMSHTYAILPKSEFPKALVGHWQGEPQPFLNFQGLYAGPGIVSNMSDMLRFVEFNLSATHPVVQRTQEISFCDPSGFSVGLGWMMERNERGESFVYHSGSTRLGFNSLCIFYPDLNLGYVLMANEATDLQRLGDIENGLMSDPNMTKWLSENNDSSRSGTVP